VENLALEFYRLPFEPYAPIRRQMLRLLRDVNAARKTAGFRAIPLEVLPLRRRVVKPFGEESSQVAGFDRVPRCVSNVQNNHRLSTYYEKDAVHRSPLSEQKLA
jgi:hypothetical protein